MTRRARHRAAAIVLTVVAAAGPAGGPATALTLDLPPGAVRTAADLRPALRDVLPIGPWRDGALPMLGRAGDVARTAWRIPGAAATPDEIAAGLRAGLEAAGYAVTFDCRDDACGGFDFRFGAGLLPAPDMHVDLGDYRYLMARGQDEAAVGVMVSRSADAAFVHLMQVSPAGAAPVAPVAPVADAAAEPAPRDGSPEQPAPQPAVGDSGGIITQLLAAGHVALDDLSFDSGSAVLPGAGYPSLATLADWLTADATRRVVLVGHTDAAGSLEANIALSRSRADAVADRLRAAPGVAAAQVAAQGVGYLAPRASNATPEGRRANRRVEAVLAN